MANRISKYDDIIDVRDIIERVEELQTLRNDYQERDLTEPLTQSWAQAFTDEADELTQLETLLADLKGNGGDEQYKGDWYPLTLIRDSYFKDYAHELAEDIGAIKHDATWPNTCIDWDQAARELRMDYTSTDIDDITYWFR